MTATVTVLRVECATCEKPHGPMNGSCWEAPYYGSVGPTPQSDPGLYRIDSHEFCGTTEEQFDAWWSDKTRDLKGFAISVYEVPATHVRKGAWQVLFDIRKANLIEKHREPERYVPTLRKGLPAAGECRGWGGWEQYIDFTPTEAEVTEAAEFYADEPAEDDDLSFMYATPVKAEPVYAFTPKRSTVARYS